MKENQSYVDQLIDEVIQENFDKAPEPPVSKEEALEKIQKQMRYKKKQNPFKRNLKKVIVAAILIVVVSTSFFQPQNASAFNWITKLFIKAQGTITQLMGTIGEPSTSDENKPTPQVIRHQGEVKLVTMRLSEAQTVASFSIVLPKKVPEGFSLRDVTVELVDDEKSDQVVVHYKRGEETLTIREINIKKQVGYSIGVDHEDTNIMEVDINGAMGTLLIFKDGSKKLIWMHQDIQYMIDSQLSEQDINQIAESM